MLNRTSVFTVLLLALAACGLPRDPGGTLKRVRSGTLRVGAVHSPPWVDMSEPSRPTGIEIDLIEAFAREHDAEIDWFTGSEESLFFALRNLNLDIVVGGFTESNLNVATVGASLPFGSSVDDAALGRLLPPSGNQLVAPQLTSNPHVLAVAPGENAFALAVDRVVHRKATE